MYNQGKVKLLEDHGSTPFGVSVMMKMIERLIKMNKDKLVCIKKTGTPAEIFDREARVARSLRIKQDYLNKYILS